MLMLWVDQDPLVHRELNGTFYALTVINVKDKALPPLNGGKRKQPKTFHLILNKVIYFLKKEVNIYFEFSLNVRKKK